MILVLSGTNRKGSNTRKIANFIYDHIKDEYSEDVKLVALDEMPTDYIHQEMYSKGKQPDSLVKVQEEAIIPSDKWIVISPEYNGSFSGILKAFIDALSIRKYAENFKNKRVALVGVSSGRAGNLRGMEHLTGFMNYLKMHVHPEKLPISAIENVLGENDSPDELTQENIHRIIKDFLR